MSNSWHCMEPKLPHTELTNDETKTTRNCNQRPPSPPGARNAARLQQVTWRHRSRDHSIRHMQCTFPIAGPVATEPLSPTVFKIFGPKIMLTNTWTHSHQQTWRIAIPPGGRKNRSLPFLSSTIGYAVYILVFSSSGQCRIKVGAIDAAALGPFVK